ncbi:DUF4926 domain-containing protein [Micromonospora sp. NPDC005686]|uniref:DUF4926 domain-containing protein n=1 Tax=unclassified Micromonospora TaxID=2617518 RepID=UPI0033BBA8D3
MDLYELVALRDAVPEEGLAAGAVGTIVHVFHRPDLAYEVEFADQDGRTLGAVVLTPNKLKQVDTTETE